MRSESGDTPVLLIGGPFEFARSARDGLYPDQAGALIGALETMAYDFFCLMDFEAELIEEAGLTVPEDWIILDRTGTISLETADGHRVALVLLPELAKNASGPDKTLARSLAGRFEDAREEHDLVVALSPWGIWPEKRWLGEMVDSWEDGPDILLGSGPGMEVQGALMAEDSVLWLRAFGKGKSVNRVDVLAWPEPGAKRTWIEGVNVRAEFGTLRETVTEDPEVLKILSGTPGQ